MLPDGHFVQKHLLFDPGLIKGFAQLRIVFNAELIELYLDLLRNAYVN